MKVIIILDDMDVAGEASLKFQSHSEPNGCRDGDEESYALAWATALYKEMTEHTDGERIDTSGETLH